jgi:hypothetical protein
MLSPIADFVVSLKQNGRINSQGTVSDALSKDAKLLKEVAETNRVAEAEEEAAKLDGTEPKDNKKSDGKLVAKEEIAEGRISLSACWSFKTVYVRLLT